MTEARQPNPAVTFYGAIPGCRAPMRADPSVLGTLPARGFQYCEALRAASSFGWYAFPPIDFSLLWDGSEVIWTYRGAKAWYPLKSAQYPGFSRYFDEAAPKRLRGFAPPFLTSTWDPSLIQVWTGLFVESAPDWSILVRPPANLQRHEGYHLYEGIVESDRWFGPLFTNLRLIKTDVPIHFSTEVPLIQVQPLHRSAYAEEISNRFGLVADLAALPADAWARYEQAIVKPNINPGPAGAYAASVRRRRKGGCPVHAE
ncbi:MAG TPA: hypothetical protein VGX52_20895 [Burkholderiales bacterium]|nr:hypothetical protein [Burkholderiales bacterium]